MRLLLLLALLLPAAAAAQDAIVVTLDRPDPFEPAYGEVEIEAVVSAEEDIERVAFYVDGVVVGELREPPYRLSVDLGEDVGEHRFQVVAYGVSGATGSGSLSTPTFRIDEEVAVALQQLYVTVTQDGRRVADLSAEDFAIFDEQRRQTLVTFARGDIPFTAAVLVDASISMEGEKLRSALAGARAFFDRMRPLDEGRLLVFSDRILHATPFTTFPEVLAAGLGRITARGGTALADHLYLALTQLEERQGRRVVILLSDGIDSHSVLAMSDALARARRSQALIYWLQLPYGESAPQSGEELPAIHTAWRDAEGYRQQFELLRQTVAESGGRIRTLSSVGEIADAFGGILAELREQYVLGYYPTAARHDGSWRRVRIRLRRPGARVRARDGYVDF